jgi:hypothetical protein
MPACNYEKQKDSDKIINTPLTEPPGTLVIRATKDGLFVKDKCVDGIGLSKLITDEIKTVRVEMEKDAGAITIREVAAVLSGAGRFEYQLAEEGGKTIKPITIPKPRGEEERFGDMNNIDLGELRIKLLWVEAKTGRQFPLRTAAETFDEYMQKVKNGRVALKVGDVVFPDTRDPVTGKTTPDFDKLRQILIAAKADYRPPEEHPGKTMPVIIDAREPVPWKHVVRVLEAAMEAGVDDITFAAPEVPY